MAKINDVYDIGAAFEAIEDELTASMIRNMKRHKAEETKEGFEWAQWQAEQLRFLEEYKKKNQKKYGKKFKSGLCFACGRRNEQRRGGSWPDGRCDTVRRAFFTRGKAAFLCDRKRDILRFSHSGTMRVRVILCAALFKIDLCFLCRVHSRAPFFFLATPKH